MIKSDEDVITCRSFGDANRVKKIITDHNCEITYEDPLPDGRVRLYFKEIDSKTKKNYISQASSQS